MNWSLWSRQIDAIVRLELRRYVRGRRWIGMYIVALAPVFLLLLRASGLREFPSEPLLQLGEMYAGFFQLFLLRFGVFMCCAVVFTQLIRGEVLEKTQHFYLLAPVRRGVIAVGKYVAGVVACASVFGASTVGTFVLLYLPSPFFRTFFAEGNGIPQLSMYLIATILACIGYGGVFLLLGLLFRNPGIPTLFLLGWESFSFAFPPVLQYFSLVYHLQSLLPVSVDRGIFAVLTETTSPVFSIPMIVLMAGVCLGIAAFVLAKAEVTYSTD